MKLSLGSLINSLPDPLFISDQNGVILLASAEAAKLMGYKDKSALVGKHIASVIVEKSETATPIGGLPPEAGHIFEASLRRADLSFILAEIHQEVLMSDTPLVLSIARDITSRKALEDKLVRMAYYDSQTALPNRHYFLEELERELLKVKETPSYTFSVVFVNIDKFKLINDQLGPRGADAVLAEVVRRIDSITEGFASMFRMSGDEFSIIIRGTNSKDYIDSLLQRTSRLVSAPMLIDGKTVFPSATFGAVLDIRGSNDASQVIALGTDAVVAGKKNGIGAITFISVREGMETLKQQSRNDLLAVGADMRRGLASLEFVPYFQPIYQLSPSRLVGFEALARWHRPSGVLEPNNFVRQAEGTGLITKIDKNVISKAIKTTKKWAETYPGIPFYVSVNASAASFRDPSFVPFILDRLEKCELDSKYFVLEVTEGIVIDNFDGAIEKLDLLRDRGIMVALDDFGTGYSSLQYVNRLPLNYIKIDKSFIDQLFFSEKARLMVKSIINMAGILGLGVVAEGMETVQQHDWLIEENKNMKVQGYFFSAPLPPEEAEHFLADANAFYGAASESAS